ncbi:MAG: YceI family protein [Candidatus Schekmanbacteria bacterium]|nr:YceI family protein [Candidatus Schekmanbacteria bacterium]
MILTNGTIKAFTYKAGLLSAVAHDLRLSLRRFEVRVEGDSLSARFWPSSFEVDGAIENGELAVDRLGEKDRRDIYSNLTAKVLLVESHPEIRYRGRIEESPAEVRLRGQLEMLGESVDTPLTLLPSGGRLVGEVTIIPTQWGIKPFSAAFGTIKLQDRVRLTFDLPRA